MSKVECGISSEKIILILYKLNYEYVKTYSNILKSLFDIMFIRIKTEKKQIYYHIPCFQVMIGELFNATPSFFPYIKTQFCC